MDSNYVYGSQSADNFLLRNPISLPRYGHLARRVMMHYLGERYNPHVDAIIHEPFLRNMIHQFISYRLFNQVPEYDWQWIDNSFRKYFSGCFDIDIPYDNERIEAGLKASAQATVQIDSDLLH